MSSAQLWDGHFVIEGNDARHLATVRRAKPGDRIRAGDGQGRVLEAVIEMVGEGRIHAEVTAEKGVAPPRPFVTVFQGLAKQGKVDLAVQKMTELGIDEVVVFAAGRSVPRWEEAKRAKMTERWTQVAYEAAKQSHRAWLPQIDGPLEPEEAVGRASMAELFLVASPSAAKSLRQVLGKGLPSSVALVVGPEGGLTDDEVLQFTGKGATPFALGSQILRTETAGLAISSILMFHFGRLG
ncbi:MAG: 16S rRNA (uracil(1498)-N(3))-methyltransferase [Actinomycetota bacterium]